MSDRAIFLALVLVSCALTISLVILTVHEILTAAS